MNDNNKTLHQLLKEQTVDLHIQAHKIPYVTNFLNNNISLISYIGHLRALAIIYGTLENQLSSKECLVINDFLVNYTLKLPLILSDLASLNADKVKDIKPAISNALHIADNILINSITNPYKLLGFIYILEGSLNGGSILKKHLSETFNLQNNDGLTYLSSFDPKFKIFWEGFVNNLNNQIQDNQKKEDIISAANELFLDLMKIYAELHPVDEKVLRNLITSINPEAGNFPIPTNPLEIKAALTAGLNCWNEFPYYEKRYGERGRRFAVSDSVWLVLLSELSEEGAIKQANWLSTLLAVRGMPTYMMEIQMQMLFDELSKSIPLNEPKYSVFLKIAESLKIQRSAHISEIHFKHSNSVFEKFYSELNLPEDASLGLKNIGKLIASSIADDSNGIPDAKNSFKNWLVNKEIFPENWILSVEKTYDEIELLLKLNSKN